MSTINLNPDGLYDWELYTVPDSTGTLELYVEGDTGNRSVWLDMPMLLRLRDVIGNALSQCPCDYVADKRICDEYPEYRLTRTDPECPFHGEKN